MKKYIFLPCFLVSLKFSCRYGALALGDFPHMSQKIEILFLVINIQLAICNTNLKSTL